MLIDQCIKYLTNDKINYLKYHLYNYLYRNFSSNPTQSMIK